MTDYLDPSKLAPLPLPPSITSRYVDTSPHSLIFHVLESKPQSHSTSTPVILLIHGFPELAFSWRHIMPLLSSPPYNYHAIAFDQRGYGRTHPPESSSPLPQESFRPVNLIRDTLHLLSALGVKSIDCLVGHDFGAVTAALCALARPDVFKSLILMSHPTKGAPALPFNTVNDPAAAAQAREPKPDMETALGQLDRPRKHYKWYYCTPPANEEMTQPTGRPLHEFLRGYFHLKSADWGGNYSPAAPHRLAGWTAPELARMPRYYIMDAEGSMRDNVARDMSTPETQTEISRRPFDRWLPDDALQVYADEYGRNSFRGGLNWYRLQTRPDVLADVELFSGLRLVVPTLFVAGDADWGTWQEPGAVESMEQGRSVDPSCWRGMRIVPRAGHWVNQEQPQVCVEAIGDMVREVRGK